MKSIYSSTTLIVALAAPLTVSCQHHDGGHDLEKRQDWTKSVDWSTVNYGNAFPTPPAASPVAPSSPDAVVVANKMVVNPASPSSSSVKVAVTPASSSSTPVVVASPSSSSTAVAVASPSSSSSPSSGGSSSSTTCSGTGMVIGWTSDSASVPLSWSGGSGTTTPGSCTDLGNFSGQLAVNGTGGTIFEGNYNGGDMYFDVSFIIGYSAPMMCHTSTGMSGCSIDLHAEAAKGGYECPQQGGEDHVCTNPVGSNGNDTPGNYGGDMGAHPWCLACSAPHAFFQPCAGSAYTFPYDDVATQHATGTIQCCIGTKCGSTGREGSTKGGHPEPVAAIPCTMCSGGASKRGLDDVFDQYEKEARALTPTLLPKKRRSAHRHAHAHGAKGAL